jgi:hypothetical protein
MTLSAFKIYNAKFKSKVQNKNTSCASLSSSILFSFQSFKFADWLCLKTKKNEELREKAHEKHALLTTQRMINIYHGA